jgi:hypothetical protein
MKQHDKGQTKGEGNPTYRGLLPKEARLPKEALS